MKIKEGQMFFVIPVLSMRLNMAIFAHILLGVSFGIIFGITPEILPEISREILIETLPRPRGVTPERTSDIHMSVHMPRKGFVNIKNLVGKKNLIYLAVIGGGPAGLSAGLYGARAGIHTVVFYGPKIGGQLSDGILVENWPGVDKDSGANVMAKLEDQVKSFGTDLIQDTIKKVDFSTWPFKLWGQNKIYYALSIVLATGATPRRLNIPGESKYWIKGGVLSCGLCDAQLARNEDVVIIGGGDATIERILQLAPFASSVKVIVRSNRLRASKRMTRKIKELENVKILYNKKVEEFVGNGEFLTGVKVYDNILKKAEIIPTKWAFLAIGFEPNTSLFKGQLQMTPDGYIKHDGFQVTSVAGIYTAGNVSDEKYKQASTASGDATKAALNAINFLRSLNIDQKLKRELKKQLFYGKLPNSQRNRYAMRDLVLLKTKDELIKAVEASEKPILLYFFSPMCSTCKFMGKVIKQFAHDLEKKITVYKISISQSPSLFKKFNVKSVPAYILLSKGKQIAQIYGQKNQKQLLEFVQKSLHR